MSTQYGVNTLDSAYQANNSAPSPSTSSATNKTVSSVYSNVAQNSPIDKTVLIILVVAFGVLLIAHIGLKASGDIVADIK